MTFYDFIFTEKRPEKYLRHIVFWITYKMFWAFWATMFFIGIKKWFSWVWLYQLKYVLILEMAYSCLVIYFLIPSFLMHKKYVKFSVLFFLFTILCYGLYVISLVLTNDLLHETRDQQLLLIWYFSMNFIISGPPVACAFLLTLKMLKNYYIKMAEKQVIVKENVQAELQLLKAQIHPHFLFNTLNNIYSFALTRSPDAQGLVLKLSDTLRYMIDDCEAALVPLEKEIQLIRNYIGLEKVRYGDRLNLELIVKGDGGNKLIVPLLMIPFVENSFKHGASIMRGKQWIRLELTIKDNWLYFNISNSKPTNNTTQNGKEGIGLANVQKRLELLYPGKHQLAVTATGDVYSVSLMVVLQEQILPLAVGNLIHEPHQFPYVE